MCCVVIFFLLILLKLCKIDVDLVKFLFLWGDFFIRKCYRINI